LRSTVGLHRTSVLAALGRDAEAEEGANEAIALTGERDEAAQLRHGTVLAGIRSRAGAHDDAVRLARESVAIAAETDSAWHRVETHVSLAEAAAAHELLRLIEEHGLTVYRERALRLA
jgi:hypothetical protein